MRAGVVDREHLAVIGVEDGDRWVRLDSPRLTAGEGREWTDFKHDRDLLVGYFVADCETEFVLCNSLMEIAQPCQVPRRASLTSHARLFGRLTTPRFPRPCRPATWRQAVGAHR